MDELDDELKMRGHDIEIGLSIKWEKQDRDTGRCRPAKLHHHHLPPPFVPLEIKPSGGNMTWKRCTQELGQNNQMLKSCSRKSAKPSLKSDKCMQFQSVNESFVKYIYCVSS